MSHHARRTAAVLGASALALGAMAGPAEAGKPGPTEPPQVTLNSVTATGSSFSGVTFCGWEAAFTPTGLAKGTKYNATVHQMNAFFDAAVVPATKASARDNGTVLAHTEAPDGSYRIQNGNTLTFYVVIEAVSRSGNTVVATSEPITTSIVCA